MSCGNCELGGDPSFCYPACVETRMDIARVHEQILAGDVPPSAARREALLREELKTLEAERDRWVDRVKTLEARIEKIRDVLDPDVCGSWGEEIGT